MDKDKKKGEEKKHAGKSENAEQNITNDNNNDDEYVSMSQKYGWRLL